MQRLILSVLVWWFAWLGAPLGAVRAAEGADPFAGKTVEEIRDLLERRLRERKKDRDFYSDYVSFFTKEQKGLVRLGNSLAAKAWSAGAYLQAEYYFRFTQYGKSLDVLRNLEQKAKRSRGRNRVLLWKIYYLMAADCAYLGKGAEAESYLRRAQDHNAVGRTLREVRRKLSELPTRLEELKTLKRIRALAPRGGQAPGGNQWRLCEHYDKFYLPLEEAIELKWMIRSFPEHPKVRSGDAAWARAQCAEKLADYREVIEQVKRFQRAYPDHWAVRQGDTLWSLSKAYFGLGSLKDAKRNAELLKRKHPKSRHVETRRADSLIRECERPPAKDRFKTGNPFNEWEDW